MILMMKMTSNLKFIRLEQRESLKLLKWKWLKMNTGITLILLYEVSNEWDYF